MKQAFYPTKTARNRNVVEERKRIAYLRRMISKLKKVCFTLFIINGLQSCSTESEVHDQNVSPLSVKDYIAEGENTDYTASAEDLKVQFHGCKAHQ
jgi:glutamate dehydrogenase/leucine dehydrogenase